MFTSGFQNFDFCWCFWPPPNTTFILWICMSCIHFNLLNWNIQNINFSQLVVIWIGNTLSLYTLKYWWHFQRVQLISKSKLNLKVIWFYCHRPIKIQCSHKKVINHVQSCKSLICSRIRFLSVIMYTRHINVEKLSQKRPGCKPNKTKMADTATSQVVNKDIRWRILQVEAIH